MESKPTAEEIVKLINLRDPSLWAIIIGNVVAIYMAFTQSWPLSHAMWVYWGQSVAIGFMNFWRMYHLKEFSTKGLKSNGRPVPETQAGARSAAFFFLFHYGGFHLAYSIFLWQEQPLSELSQDRMMMILIGICTFIAAHNFSLRYNANKDFKEKKPNLGTIMFYPYLRIFPMHLTIIFGSMFTGVAIIIFMVLKTIADAAMHSVEHYLFQKKENHLRV